ncbi:hypothetical protein ACP70R_040109 [Stipagrostis hirtigluma subsp. patula]
MTTTFWAAVRALKLPLSLPQRLTIPDASREQWSKPAAVTAATLAPLLLSFLCRRVLGRRARAGASPQPPAAADDTGREQGAVEQAGGGDRGHARSAPPLLPLPPRRRGRGKHILAILLGGLAGLALGFVAFLTTDASAPPTRFLAAWLAGGFVMSAAWAYVIVREVLSLLVAAGAAMSVDTAALGSPCSPGATRLTTSPRTWPWPPTATPAVCRWRPLHEIGLLEMMMRGW